MVAEPAVLSAAECPALKWNPPDAAGLVAYLVEEKQFSEDRVRKVVEKINASRSKSNQGRHKETHYASVGAVVAEQPCWGSHQSLLLRLIKHQ